MNQYAGLCDDIYLNLNLCTEMDLPSGRETVLHYFEQLQKKYPTMRNFYCRDKGDFVLEEDKDQGHYRWASIEARRICSGTVNPASVETALEQHEYVLDLAPHLLSVSPLDCEALDLLFGFDFTYRGNHNQLVMEALGLPPAIERVAEFGGVQTVNYEPSITLALDEECRQQIRLNVETRTNAYQIRTGDYPEEQLSVYLTARRYGSMESGQSLVEAASELARLSCELIDDFVVGQILQPLARAIAMK